MKSENKNITDKIEQYNLDGPSVRRATPDDIVGIMKVACSVGSAEKIHSQGFLMDDYVKDYDYFKDKFTKLIGELQHFYVIETDMILGFLIAYKKEEWLGYNPSWFQDIMWSPGFDMKNTDNFILVDKTAIMRGITGKGLGSILYKSLISDMKRIGICDMLAETIISPVPNFASLEFRIKQKYSLAGVRYEEYKGTVYTDLIYHKSV